MIGIDYASSSIEFRGQMEGLPHLHAARKVCRNLSSNYIDTPPVTEPSYTNCTSFHSSSSPIYASISSLVRCCL